MPSLTLILVLLSIIGTMSCYQRDELIPSYEYNPPDTYKSHRSYSPSTFVYGLWKDIASMKELTDIGALNSPKELIVKLVRMVVSRVFFDLHSITFNFLLML